MQQRARHTAMVELEGWRYQQLDRNQPCSLRQSTAETLLRLQALLEIVFDPMQRTCTHILNKGRRPQSNLYIITKDLQSVWWYLYCCHDYIDRHHLLLMHIDSEHSVNVQNVYTYL